MGKLLKYIKPFLVPLIVSLVLQIIRSLSDLYLPNLTADIVDIGIVNGDIPYILRVGAFMLLITAFGVACSIIAGYISAKAGNGFCEVLRDKVFTRVESLSLEEFDRFGTASLITRTTNDINQIRSILDFGLRMLIMAPIMSVGSVVLAFSRDPLLAIIFVIAIPILGTIIYFIMKKGLPLFTSMQGKLDRLNLIIREALTGVRVIRAFNRDKSEEFRFKAVNKDYTDTSISVNRIMGAMMPLVTLVMNVAVILVVWFGGFRINTGKIMVGDLMAFIQYAVLVMSSLIALTRVFIIIPRATVSADRISQVLETMPEITDPEIEREMGGQHGTVEFKNVTFSYPGAEYPTLEEISFTALPGQVTVIIGGTGSGKSTLAGLILRLHDVSCGSVSVNGIDVRDLKQETLRSKIGYVPQKAVLFSGTVRENICYGKENATDDEIMRAADTAQASDFIRDMKDGLNTQIAQDGKNVSGGQKQRLSIARALVRKPDIYILDDSFSALDFKTEAKLRKALRKETGQSTVLLISQRVGTIKDADQIIVLEKGRIAGVGTHDALLSDCDVYREIVATQLSKEESA